MGLHTTIEGDLDGLFSGFLINQRQNIVKPYIHHVKNILDIGCGVFRWNDVINDQQDYIGVDFEKAIINHNVDNYPDHTFLHIDLDQDELPHLEKPIDLVIMLAVIEHFKNPQFVLKQIVNNLSEDGIIIISTPHPFGEVILELGSKIRLFARDKYQHQDLLNKKSIQKLANEVGADLVESGKFLFGFNQKFILKKSK